jgi:hypothetical protein
MSNAIFSFHDQEEKKTYSTSAYFELNYHLVPVPSYISGDKPFISIVGFVDGSARTRNLLTLNTVINVTRVFTVGSFRRQSRENTT